jgi:hypothetical protein
VVGKWTFIISGYLDPGDLVGRKVPNWTEVDIVEQHNTLVMMKTTTEELLEIELEEGKEEDSRA